jgi:YD repeat-containing protein
MTYDPLGHENRAEFGIGALVHDATKVFNALNKRWDISYDGRGNVLTVTDPLLHRTTFEYDGLNNLTKVIPPGEEPNSSNTAKQVVMDYAPSPGEANLFPTSPKRIIEPKANPSDPGDPPTTVLQYYGLLPGETSAFGKLEKVTPPFTFNPVATEYEYDNFGQPRKWREGPPSDPNLTQPPAAVTGETIIDSDGRLKSGCSAGICFSFWIFDDAGRVVCVTCSASPSLEQDVEIEPCFPRGCPTTQPCDDCDLPIIRREVKPPMESGCTDGNIERNPNGEITRLPRCAVDGITGTQGRRTHEMAYDELGRLTSWTVNSTELTGAQAPPDLTRTFTYNPDWQTGHFTQAGPDGTSTETWLDAAGRVESFVRKDAAGNQFMSATLTYDAADRVTVVDYGNGTGMFYAYDNANRILKIEQLSGAGPLKRLVYEWSADGLVNNIFDYDFEESASPDVINFSYDNRNRLIEEERTGLYPYHLRYTYDKAGNRMSKYDVPAQVVTLYTYDVQDPSHYGSQGNRLVKSSVHEYDGAANWVPGPALAERYYMYDMGGRVNYVDRKRRQDDF